MPDDLTSKSRTKTEYLSVSGFDELRHYKDRAMIWIKIHLTLLDDYRYLKLPDDAKAHLINLMLLAARRGNRLPNDAAFLAQQIGANTPIQLDVLLESKFLIPAKRLKAKRDSASASLAETKQDATHKQQQEQQALAATQTTSLTDSTSVRVASKHSKETIHRYAKAHNLGAGWETKARRTGEWDADIDDSLESQKPKPTIRERLEQKWKEEKENAVKES